MWRLFVTFSVAGALALPATRVTAQSCVGDCGGDSEVTVDELVVGVNIALGSQELAFCPQFDCNGDGEVTVDCLVKGVNNALCGCDQACPTPAPTLSPTVTRTDTQTLPPTSTPSPPRTATPSATPTATTILGFMMAEYYPLGVGDSWTYNCFPTGEECDGTVVRQVLGREIFNGRNLLKVGAPGTDEPDFWDINNGVIEWHGWRWQDHTYPEWIYSTVDPPLQVFPRQMSIGERHTFATTETETWIEDGEEGHCVYSSSLDVLLEKVTACPVVLAGQPVDCLQLSVKSDGASCDYDDPGTGTWWLARGVGPVKMVSSEDGTWVLRRATVGGRRYP